MFTGIIEEIGRMKKISRQGQAMVLTLAAKRILEDVHIGDSIAVNGVCLTVISYGDSEFSVDVMPETFRATNLYTLQVGSKVNLERAMPANGRFGGHMVQGHVDATGTIISRTKDENSVVFTVQPDTPDVLRHVIHKGSVTLDGISLTVVKVSETSLTVSIIPHTLAQTILQEKQTGDTVNIEGDLLGKYIDHLLHGRQAGSRGNPKAGSITEQFLMKHGFM